MVGHACGGAARGAAGAGSWRPPPLPSPLGSHTAICHPGGKPWAKLPPAAPLHTVLTPPEGWLVHAPGPGDGTLLPHPPPPSGTLLGAQYPDKAPAPCSKSRGGESRRTRRQIRWSKALGRGRRGRSWERYTSSCNRIGRRCPQREALGHGPWGRREAGEVFTPRAHRAAPGGLGTGRPCDRLSCLLPATGWARRRPSRQHLLAPSTEPRRPDGSPGAEALDAGRQRGHRSRERGQRGRPW